MEVEVPHIVEAFQSHLAIRGILEYVTTLVIDDLDRYDIREIADTYLVPLCDLQRKIDLTQKKITFLTAKPKFEAAVSEYRHPRQLPAGSSQSQIAYHYGINKSILNYEILKFPNPEIPYEYDRYVTRPRIFTYNGEITILNLLIVWKYSPDPDMCVCPICTICQLLQLADQSIQFKTQQFRTRYNRDKLQWLKEFEMKYHREIIASGLF